MRRPDVVYLPATDSRPAEPAPFVLTGEEVARLARMNCQDASSAMKRLREKGWLRGTKIGTELVYTLPDVLDCIEKARGEDPR